MSLNNKVFPYHPKSATLSEMVFPFLKKRGYGCVSQRLLLHERGKLVLIDGFFPISCSQYFVFVSICWFLWRFEKEENMWHFFLWMWQRSCPFRSFLKQRLDPSKTFPENWWLEYSFPFKKVQFSGAELSVLVVGGLANFSSSTFWQTLQTSIWVFPKMVVPNNHGFSY